MPAQVETLPVIFRTFPDGDVIAIFPTQEEWRPYRVASYQHGGQHGAVDRGIIDRTRPATEDEYAPLLAELRGIYERPDDPERVELVVRRRWSRRKHHAV